MTVTPLSDAQIIPFYLTSGAENVALIRGRIASVGQPATTILQRHAYPPAIAKIQAEALALTACLASTLKFHGIFTLQAKGDAQVKTLLADMTSDGDLRGYVAFDADAKSSDDAIANLPSNVPELMGSGHIAFTIDEGATGGRYQGIVDLKGATLSDTATAWFANSEQLDTLFVAASQQQGEQWQANSMMLQRIAAKGGENGSAADLDLSDDAWHTAKTLMESVQFDEMVDPRLGPEALIFRLFNSMEPHVAPAREVRDKCRCSPWRVENMLGQLDPADIKDLANAAGYVEITCEFCKITRKIHIDEIGTALAPQ